MVAEDGLSRSGLNALVTEQMIQTWTGSLKVQMKEQMTDFHMANSKIWTIEQVSGCQLEVSDGGGRKLGCPHWQLQIPGFRAQTGLHGQDWNAIVTSRRKGLRLRRRKTTEWRDLAFSSRKVTTHSPFALKFPNLARDALSSTLNLMVTSNRRWEKPQSTRGKAMLDLKPYKHSGAAYVGFIQGSEKGTSSQIWRFAQEGDYSSVEKWAKNILTSEKFLRRTPLRYAECPTCHDHNKAPNWKISKQTT